MLGLKALRTGSPFGARRTGFSLFIGLALPACAFWELSDWDANEGRLVEAPKDSAADGAESGASDGAPALNRYDYQNGVSPTASYLGTVDTVIRENAPNDAGGTTDPLHVDHDSPLGKRVVTLMRFDISDLKGRTVTSARLRLQITDPTTGPTPFNVYPLMRAWSDTNATWVFADPGNWTFPGAQQDAGSSPDRGGYLIGQMSPKVEGPVDIDFTAAGVNLVQTWINDPAKNFGFVFDTRDNGDGVFFSSATAPNPSERPRLTIELAPL